ncbi:MAG: DUF2063 domain-containing protein, partial [Gammaproteobacteria bacterium]
NNPAPDNIEDRRMAIYRDLLYNNIEGFMSSNFPVIRGIMTDDEWHKLIRNYFVNHNASTPLFPKLPTEFLSFLENEFDQNDQCPYLIELAHYEWVESALGIDTREIDDSEVDQKTEIFTGIPLVNNLILRLAYDYPVQKISKSFLPTEKPDQQTYLVVYRDRQDKIGFMELNQVTARLLERMCEIVDQTGQQHLQAIAEELQHPQPEIVIQGGLQVLQQMQQRDIILGAKNP